LPDGLDASLAAALGFSGVAARADFAAGRAETKIIIIKSGEATLS